MWLNGGGWALDILLGAVDFTRCPSKTVRRCLFGILRDVWQLQPSLQVSAQPIRGSTPKFSDKPGYPCGTMRILTGAIEVCGYDLDLCSTDIFGTWLLRRSFHSEGQEHMPLVACHISGSCT